MVLEIADFLIREGAEDAFTTAYRDAVKFITSSPGCRGARLVRGVENPQRFVLLVEWQRLEDHLDGFRGSPAFQQWRAAVGPFFAADPRVEHGMDA
ncbi:MAG TPA: antibiotic biosynthesis monooxygenase family protein [Pseudonocardiaceae bacterium]|jgi:quinol monooxygenase YgiN